MLLEERCRQIEMLVLDVDGVLTDGSIVYSDQGAELKAFHVRDGSGLKIWMACGKKASLLTGRASSVVARRAAELGVTAVVQGASDKLAVALRNCLTKADRVALCRQGCLEDQQLLQLQALAHRRDVVDDRSGELLIAQP